jgi:hypothetical protein
MGEGLGDWIKRRLRKGVKKQGEKAAEDLKESGISITVLREQWDLQQKAQLSLRARKSLCSQTQILTLKVPARCSGTT